MNENEKVEVMCEEIRRQAEQQKEAILQKAGEEAQKIIDDAQIQVREFEEDEKKKNEEEIQKLKERIYSTQTIEKKRITLSQEGIFVKKVFDKVAESAHNFRNAPQYKDFLKKSIKEGIEIINTDKVETIFSQMDEKSFTPEFVEEVKKFCNAEPDKNLFIDFQKGNFADIGVIVRSSDKRIVYDTRFSTIFDRLKISLQIEIVKEVFKDA